jgi:uncharacterized membrane protein YccC
LFYPFHRPPLMLDPLALGLSFFTYSVIDSNQCCDAGATLSKGFNRGLGTLTAGAFALVVAELSKHLGKLEEVILITSILIVGKHLHSESNRFFFSLKAAYEYI